MIATKNTKLQEKYLVGHEINAKSCIQCRIRTSAQMKLADNYYYISTITTTLPGHVIDVLHSVVVA